VQEHKHLPPVTSPASGSGLPSAGLNRRQMQVALGIPWLSDGALQFRPFMFSRGFLTHVIEPSTGRKEKLTAGCAHHRRAAAEFQAAPTSRAITGLPTTVEAGPGRARSLAKRKPDMRKRLLPAMLVAPVLVAVLGFSGLIAAGGPAASSAATTMPATGIHFNAKKRAFHDAMRALWEIHGTFTERAIVDFVGGLPDTPNVIRHLQRNQVNIGNAIKPFYGSKAGDELTSLLHQHITDAVNCVVAAKAGDQAKLQAAEKAFFANGNQIARFLHAANPRFWSLPAMKTMMRIHLNQVLALAVDQIKGHYTANIRLYGVYIHHLLFGMADMLSNGIMEQFPGKFR
jgi:hypothetical protein